MKQAGIFFMYVLVLPTKRYGFFGIRFQRFDSSAHHFIFKVSIESSIEREISERVKLNVLDSDNNETFFAMGIP